MTTQAANRKIVSVILAAGKGTRMKTPNLHKVCFTVEHTPVIARAIETYRRCGVDTHWVVVGSLAEQVMQAASIVQSNVLFCYQKEQRGTGNATRAAARALQATGYDGDVLVVAGDKVIEEAILRKLIARFRETDSDLTFAVGDMNDFPDSGRIVCDRDGRILGNVEVFDIARMHLLNALRRVATERPMSPSEAEGMALGYLKQEKKAALALGALWDAIKTGNAVTRTMLENNFTDEDYLLRVNQQRLPPELLSQARYANLSLYLFKAPALYSALEKLSSDNAQQEEYLTDALGILTDEGRRLSMLPVDYPQQIMAFNTPEELREIEDYLAGQRRLSVQGPPRASRPASEWLRHLESSSLESTRCLAAIYGDDHLRFEAKRQFLAAALRVYATEYGDEAVMVTRAPGRVNIMGRHVDHQGGHVNMIAIDREIVMIVGPRRDTTVRLRNLEPHHFADRTFSVAELAGMNRGGSWMDFVNGEAVRKRLAAAPGDWAHYVAAPFLRLQAEFPDRPLNGMNIVAAGNVPMAAGLSSSSALLVATAEALARSNQLNLEPGRFVELCGEAEWYVGTRGGAGDHSAMKFARRGQVVQMSFFPFGVVGGVSLPPDHAFVICNSHAKAKKTQGARDLFNHRVACYHLGREVLKQAFPAFAPRIEHLRDFSTQRLGVSKAELLRMLKKLPVSLSRREIAAQLPAEIAERYLATHAAAFDCYPLRAVVMFGLAECERSRECTRLLNTGDVVEFGRWMNTSHDGDRVVRWDDRGNSWPFAPDYSDTGLDALVRRAEERPAEDALARQPGAFACSIPQIDHMVDLALSVKGVLGAQLSGAGLGGCIMVLARTDAIPDLARVLTRGFYAPAGLEPELFACAPVGGSGVLEL